MNKDDLSKEKPYNCLCFREVVVKSAVKMTAWLGCQKQTLETLSCLFAIDEPANFPFRLLTRGSLVRAQHGSSMESIS
jgi:hypothetical protein